MIIKSTIKSTMNKYVVSRAHESYVLQIKSFVMYLKILR